MNPSVMLTQSSGFSCLALNKEKDSNYNRQRNLPELLELIPMYFTEKQLGKILLDLIY